METIRVAQDAAPHVASDLHRWIETTRVSPADTDARTARIYEAILAESRHVKAGNFESVAPSDLERLFQHYDAAFFDNRCRRALGASRLHFRLSRRMTKIGGSTTRFTPPPGRGLARYEIAVSTTLLYHTFRDVGRPITVNGLHCRDRLEALQRILEHEIVHLIEMLIWSCSSCSDERFQAIAARFFQHTDHRHMLVTPVEVAATRYGFLPGDRVRFRIDGRSHEGIVNRITRRATVLVEDRSGVRYSDGRRYLKFYIPLSMLEKPGATEGA